MERKEEYKKFEELLERYLSSNKDKNVSKKLRLKILDLHGYKKDEALEKVLIILRSAKKESLEKLEIICGKGKHSENGPVLFESVKNFLKENKNYFKTFTFDKNNNIFVYF
ncbi:MAG: Smr/MutS family protein [bacterium]|uniref:Smr protein/MutS2 n=2 Tax=Bacteria candidate phyla TaxID=1783234 RepID=A0A101I1P1_UNCT6|nr:MAG: Smr protein/MutS2 [candidate division TA06 bacterium 32_111]KUK87008.1 MAG: Smr protein/MutS2 [candidate division TA06 bacterium 34_109]MDI6701260.1 Smr/MutS family protein [bacterium]HAF06826.1 hypothetical protein [candidate division WOR-3 bacterium]HCP17001.1 hypothetical protein [candidate division WOR-3 bacterium]